LSCIGGGGIVEIPNLNAATMNIYYRNYQKLMQLVPTLLDIKTGPS
jgi:hypothetical protein